MKIIQEGKKEKCSMEVTCRECGSILEIEPDDIEVILDQNMGYMSLSNFKYTCPCCNRINLMSFDELSEDMKVELEKRESIC